MVFVNLTPRKLPERLFPEKVRNVTFRGRYLYRKIGVPPHSTPPLEQLSQYEPERTSKWKGDKILKKRGKVKKIFWVVLTVSLKEGRQLLQMVRVVEKRCLKRPNA